MSKTLVPSRVWPSRPLIRWPLLIALFAATAAVPQMVTTSAQSYEDDGEDNDTGADSDDSDTSHEDDQDNRGPDNAGRERGSDDDGEEPGDEAHQSGTGRGSTEQCSEKIVGGCESNAGAWPSMATLHQADNPDSPFCGGTVIDSQFVLTAAHCITSMEKVGKVDRPTVLKLTNRVPGEIVVREGVRKFGNAAAEDKGRVVRVTEIIRHPDYTVTQFPTRDGGNDTSFVNDIALLRLAEPAKAPRQTIIKRAAIGSMLQPGNVATVVGFGLTAEDAQTVSEKLMQVDVPIVSEQACKQSYEMMDYGARICAGLEEGGKDSCQGDSGGPLFIRDKLKQPVQVGVVSYGHGCARAKEWGVYSSVAVFEDWIRQRVPDVVFTDEGGGNGGNGSGGGSLEQFVSGQGDSNPSQLGQIVVDVATGNDVRVGEQIKISVTSSRDGRLVVLNRDEQGQTTQLFPNAFSKGTAAGMLRELVKAGETVVIPGPDDGFSLKATPPAGGNEIIAIVVPEGTNMSGLTDKAKDMKPIPNPQAYLATLANRAIAVEGTSASASSGRAVGQRKYRIVQ